MNENLDLTEILKECPKGTKFYSSTHGEVYFYRIYETSEYPVAFTTSHGGFFFCLPDGRYHKTCDGECIVFPSKDQRDWRKFTAPWYKKGKFDPNTLKTFDRVLTRPSEDEKWDINFYSYKNPNWPYPYICIDGSYKRCIPYNDDTKHLVGTTEEASEYYKHWEE